MSSSIVKDTYFSIKYSFVFKILEQGSVFVLSIILARLLSPEEFGVVALANLIFYYANNFTNMGFNNALVQTKHFNQKQLNSVFTVDLLISSLLMVLLYVFAQETANFFNNQDLVSVLKWMSVYFVITTFHSIPMVILRRELRFRFISLAEYLQSLSNYGFAILLAYLNFSYWAIIYPTIALSVVFALIFIIKTGWLPKICYSHSDMRRIYTFGFWSFIRSQAYLLVTKIDYFVIGKYLPIKSLGIYEKSFELTERALRSATLPLNSVLFSSFSRLQGDVKSQQAIFFDAITILVMVLMPSIFGLITLAPYFVLSLLGEQWIDAIAPIQILTGSLLFKISGGTIASLNIANGKFKAQTLYELVTTMVLVVLCFSLVRYGILYICLAVCVYSALNYTFSLVLLKLTIGISLAQFFKIYIQPVSISMIMVVVVLFFSGHLLTDHSSILHFLCLVLIGMAVYIPILLWWCGKTISRLKALFLQ